MKLHKFDPISFIAGLFFTAIGLVFLIPAEPGDLFDFFGGVDELAAWFWPILFIAIGSAVLIPLLLRSGRQPDEESETSQTL